MAAADALVEFKDNRVIEPLITILNDGDFHFGPAAARLLGKIKDDRVVDALISVLKDHHKGSSTRSAVARVLGEIMENQAVEPLIDILEDNEDMNIQIIAVRALGKFKDKRAVEPLINLLEDIQGEDTQGDNIKNDIFSASFNEELNKMVNEGKNNSRIILRAGAAEAMGEIKDKSAIKPLKAASKEHDYKISSKAAEALEKLRSK
jgi:HEAT repeat protein